MNYRLIVIDESLKNRNILKGYPVISQTWFGKGSSQESPMLKIIIPASEVNELTKQLAATLLLPYYAHLYHENPGNDTLIVIFHGKMFTTSKKDPKDAVEYGLVHGVTKEQMDIAPRNISEELW